jgi:hypothetical protein
MQEHLHPKVALSTCHPQNLPITHPFSFHSPSHNILSGKANIQPLLQKKYPSAFTSSNEIKKARF